MKTISLQNIRQHLKETDSYISLLERENKRLYEENERLKKKIKDIKKTVK